MSSLKLKYLFCKKQQLRSLELTDDCHLTFDVNENSQQNNNKVLFSATDYEQILHGHNFHTRPSVVKFRLQRFKNSAWKYRLQAKFCKEAQSRQKKSSYGNVR